MWNTLSQVSQLREKPAAIHVLVANLPGVLSELVMQSLHGQQNIVLEGQVQGQVELLLAVQKTTDVLILGVYALEPPPGICSQLLTEFPHLKILAIQIGSDEWALYWLAMQRQQFQQLSMATLAEGVRQAYRLDIT